MAKLFKAIAFIMLQGAVVTAGLSAAELTITRETLIKGAIYSTSLGMFGFLIFAIGFQYRFYVYLLATVFMFGVTVGHLAAVIKYPNEGFGRGLTITATAMVINLWLTARKPNSRMAKR